MNVDEVMQSERDENERELHTALEVYELKLLGIKSSHSYHI